MLWFEVVWIRHEKKYNGKFLRFHGEKMYIVHFGVVNRDKLVISLNKIHGMNQVSK